MDCTKMLKLLAIACLIYVVSASNEESKNDEVLNSKDRDMRLFAYYSTSKFITSLTTSTSVRFLTCFSLGTSNTCLGRRRRRRRDLAIPDFSNKKK